MKHILLTTFLLLASSQTALFADIYNVAIDTSSISGAGYIDIQFNPAPGSSAGTYAPGSVTLRNFLLSGSGASLGAEDVSFRVSATGDLVPGPLTITNADFTQPNGVVYNAVFGSMLNFQLEFAGAAYTTAPGQSFLTDFSIGLYGSSGQVVAIATLLGGSSLDTSLSDPQVTIAPQSSAVPEPSVLLTLSAAPFAALLLVRKHSGRGRRSDSRQIAAA